MFKNLIYIPIVLTRLLICIFVLIFGLIFLLFLPVILICETDKKIQKNNRIFLHNRINKTFSVKKMLKIIF